MLDQLSQIGLFPRRPFDLRRLPGELAQAVSEGADQAQRSISSLAWAIGTDADSPWSLHARERDGQETLLQTAIRAHHCIGLNLKEDAVYFLAGVDRDGQILNGQHRYRIHFDQFSAPHVDGCWSLTAYDLNGDLFAPVGGRLGSSSDGGLRFNADGSVDLRIQCDPPADLLAANWTPCPPGDFRLVLRAYRPRETLLDGLWRPPAARRLRDDRRRFAGASMSAGAMEMNLTQSLGYRGTPV